MGGCQNYGLFWIHDLIRHLVFGGPKRGPHSHDHPCMYIEIPQTHVVYVSECVCVYIYIHTRVCVCAYLDKHAYIYIYVEREREINKLFFSCIYFLIWVLCCKPICTEQPSPEQLPCFASRAGSAKAYAMQQLSTEEMGVSKNWGLEPI